MRSHLTTNLQLERPALASIGPVHRFALAAVWITFVASAIVFTEPAPVDVLMCGLIVMLPVIGLVRITPPLMVYLAIWLISGACALLGTFFATDVSGALIHTSITLFLALSSFVTAAFVMRRPLGHTQLIMNAYLIAAAIASLLAIVGYLNLMPGAFDLFTRYGRASGTFKDPNVFAPFLVPPLVYLIQRMLVGRFSRGMLAGLLALVLAFGVVLSFSRGAWINLAVSVTVFGYLTFVTAETNWLRLKILGGAFIAAFLGLLVLGTALQFDAFADQLRNRATLDQTYDEGPEGRFGGQEKARRLIVENPLGIGAHQFAGQHHLEEPHNVYLSMFLNGGWIGGMIFALMVALTGLFGLRHAFKRTRTQALFIVAYACFVAHAVEGFVIDLDHWRHFHLLMALVWGLMLGDRTLVSMMPLDPRQIFERAEMIVGRRPGRLLQPKALPSARRQTFARRAIGREDATTSSDRRRMIARRIPT